MLFQMLTGRLPFTGDTPLSVAYQHVNTDVPAPSTLTPGLPAAVDQLVLAATSRDPARRPADAGEFLRAVRRVCDGLRESSGLTGMLGVGVQGLDEAPWLDLNTPAATNGWWAHSGTMPAANGTGPSDPRPSGPDPAGTDPFGTASFAAGSFGGGSFGGGSFGTGSFGSGHDDVSSHTLVVHREDGGRHLSRREPLLQRWLFSPRLLVIVLVVAVGVALGLGSWWLATGRYAQVPVVTGDSVTIATAALTADGFTVKKSTREPSNTIAAGKVLGTSPAGRVSKGAAIALVVSSGPFTSVVPNVQHDQLAQAQAALQRLHLISATPQKVASTFPTGSVVGTNPAAGTTWPQTKPVTILVSAGLPLPDFSGENIQTAQQWASQHGVTLTPQADNNSQQPNGTITGQQPAAGSTFQPGQTITVKVSTGPQILNVPDPDGMSVAQATQLLQLAGFQVQVNKYGPFDKVFDYSPVVQAPRGSTITLDVGY